MAWPGQGKLSDRTGNCVTKVPGYVVYSVVSSTHYQTNVPLCSGSHKITCLHALCDSIGTALVLRPRRIAHMAPLHRKHFHRNHGSLTGLRSQHGDDAYTTVHGRSSKQSKSCNEIRPSRSSHGIIDDLPIHGVVTAAVGWTTRQPERRHCQVERITTRRL